MITLFVHNTQISTGYRLSFTSCGVDILYIRLIFLANSSHRHGHP